jgi:hypothetical protein
MALTRRQRFFALALFLVGLSVTGASRAAAQTPRVLDVGTRVRVRLEGQPFQLVGYIAEVRRDTLMLARPAVQFESWRPLAVSAIEQLDISAGHRRRTALGFVIGAVSGVLLTAAYNGIIQSQCFSSCPEPVSVAIGAAAGSLMLGSAFYFVRAERWLPVALPNSRDPGR